MKPISITALVKKYGPGYVAKDKKTGKVVSHAKRLDVLAKKTGKRTDVVFSWIPKPGARYTLPSANVTMSPWQNLDFNN